MGADEEVLVKLVTAMPSVIQTEPSRLKVDLWCSYVNMDIGSMDNLQVESLG